MSNRNYSGYRVIHPQIFMRDIAATRDENSHGTPHQPVHPNVYAEHVTYQYPSRTPAPPAQIVQAMGYVCNDAVEAVVVSVNGTRVRPGGGTFHVTISVADGHRPVESNDAIRNGKIEWFDRPFPVTVEPF